MLFLRRNGMYKIRYLGVVVIQIQYHSGGFVCEMNNFRCKYNNANYK